MNPGQVVDPVKTKNINVLNKPVHPYVETFNMEENKYNSFTTMVNSESPREIDTKNREKQYLVEVKKLQEERRLQKILQEKERLQKLLEEELAKKKLLEEKRKKQEIKSSNIAKVTPTPSRGGGSNADNLVKYVSNYTDTSSAKLYVDLCVQYGKEYNIDPVWLLAIMKTESTFKNNVVSSAGARGLMQFLQELPSI